MSTRCNKERRGIEETLPAKEEQLRKLRETTSNVGAFIEKTKKYVNIEERAGKYARNSLQEVHTIYRDIKIVDTDLMTTKKTA